MKLDLAGKQFGYLTAIRPAERTKHGKIKWLWKCKCGKDVLAVGSAVKCGNTKSCGCVRPLTAYKTHGLSRGGKRTPEYAAFHSIIMRCTNPNTDAYPNYGGRGITVCDRWIGENGLLNFIEDMGKRPSDIHSIDRIDTNGPYSPENCRWATPAQQALNKRNNQYFEYNGKRMTIAEWARETGIRAGKIRWRLRKGLPLEEVLGKHDFRHRNGGRSTKATRPTDRRLKVNKQAVC